MRKIRFDVGSWRFQFDRGVRPRMFLLRKGTCGCHWQWLISLYFFGIQVLYPRYK
jgi:hypothetical protein